MKGIAACFWAVAWQDQLLGRRPEESDNEKGSRLPEALIAIVEATYAELVILWGLVNQLEIAIPPDSYQEVIESKSQVDKIIGNYANS